MELEKNFRRKVRARVCVTSVVFPLLNPDWLLRNKPDFYVNKAKIMESVKEAFWQDVFLVS